MTGYRRLTQALVAALAIGLWGNGCRSARDTYTFEVDGRVVANVLRVHVADRLTQEIRDVQFEPLLRVMDEGELQKIRFEMFTTGSQDDERVVIESQDPEVLNSVQDGLVAAERTARASIGGSGCGCPGTLTIYTPTRCALMGVTAAGFVAGVAAPNHLSRFRSAPLARALDELYFAETGEHLHEHLMQGLSERMAAPWEGEWEPIWRPDRQRERAYEPGGPGFGFGGLAVPEEGWSGDS